MTPKSPRQLAFSLLVYVFLLHAATLYLFTRGFLLTRLSLPNVSSCSTCTLPPTHSRVVLLIIDALRFDFLSPDPPSPPSPHHHHVLTLPWKLTSESPVNSFLFNTFADPPTTTLQRIKGITTGSLPTFVDMGSNFAASEIVEDSLILQITNAGKKVAFMGDDTWKTVYPTSFDPNMSFPYDSFNVEDLHSVDEGVIRHLFPLMEKNATSSWDFLIGHFLGVDHVAHRLGPAHPTMAAKLSQMNDVLTRVVESLDDETLLVVMGDHGMDRKGDHGGDGELETSAATWIYSKSIPLSSRDYNPPSQLAPNITFPGATLSHRSIQQIDLVPTLSLLLGLPIPFNNLGTIIPELFGSEGETHVERALRMNARQIRSYFDAYRSSASGGELDTVWEDIDSTWNSMLQSDGEKTSLALHEFTRLALTSCRSLWAQFNIFLMYAGLFTLATANLAVWALFVYLGSVPEHWEAHGWDIMKRTGISSGFGAALVIVLNIVGLTKSIGLFESSLIGATLGSSLTILLFTVPMLSFSPKMSTFPITLVLHALAFLSNSFTFWEDRILTYLLTTSLVPSIFSAFMAPKSDMRLRLRVYLFSALFAVCVRLAGISTVCREEQHPYCHVTFYASSSLPSPPLLVLLLSVPTSLAFPTYVRRILAISRSDKGIAPLFLEWGLRGALLVGNGCWILEWLESGEIFGSEWAGTLRLARTIAARSAMSTVLVGGGILWWFSPLCLELSQPTTQSGKKEVQVIGFANSYGSSFLLFALIPFSLLIIATQLTGQITLMLSMTAFLAYLEIIDSARDLRAGVVTLDKAEGDGVPKVSFAEVAPVALLALHAFYSTGHQSTMPSIQWKTAFLLTPTLSYHLSAFLVIFNTFGPQFVLAVAVPLLAIWKVAPLKFIASRDKKSSSESSDPPRSSVNSHVLVSAIRASLGLSLYFSVLLLSSAASSAWLRRHLMVWKVFAPRFMSAGAAVLVVDLGVMVGVILGVGPVVQKVYKTFGTLA